MSTFTAIVVSNQNFLGLQRVLIDLCDGQARKPDEVLVYGTAPLRVPTLFAGSEVVFSERPFRGDWGHADRAEGVGAASSDYVGFFNDDDSYEPDYIETMMDAVEQRDADVAFCDWNTFPRDCEFRLGVSTSGNYIVRASLARRVGYPATKIYENDGHFIDALAAATDKVVHVPWVLYRHNVQ